mmetsp:Transcript_23876/g.43079  ORF Transcript_23876/g.43079 Transcript_23876/m.43079 type:complete len:451 (-) Transcript_23876:2661-4013(-)
MSRAASRFRVKSRRHSQSSPACRWPRYRVWIRAAEMFSRRCVRILTCSSFARIASWASASRPTWSWRWASFAAVMLSIRPCMRSNRRCVSSSRNCSDFAISPTCAERLARNAASSGPARPAKGDPAMAVPPSTGKSAALPSPTVGCCPSDWTSRPALPSLSRLFTRRWGLMPSSFSISSKSTMNFSRASRSMNRSESRDHRSLDSIVMNAQMRSQAASSSRSIGYRASASQVSHFRRNALSKADTISSHLVSSSRAASMRRSSSSFSTAARSFSHFRSQGLRRAASASTFSLRMSSAHSASTRSTSSGRIEASPRIRSSRRLTKRASILRSSPRAAWNCCLVRSLCSVRQSCCSNCSSAARSSTSLAARGCSRPSARWRHSWSASLRSSARFSACRWPYLWKARSSCHCFSSIWRIPVWARSTSLATSWATTRESSTICNGGWALVGARG